MRWEQINRAHVLLALRPLYFCHSRRVQDISLLLVACCWRDSLKFEHRRVSQIALQPLFLHSPQITAVWLLAFPHLQSSYPHRVGGRIGLCLLMIVFPQSRLYSHVFQCPLEDSPYSARVIKLWIRNGQRQHNILNEFATCHG